MVSITSILLFFAMAYNVALFYWEGGFNNVLATRLFYIFALGVVTLGYIGVIELKFLNRAVGIVYDGLGGVETQIGGLSAELREKMKDRFTTAKKKSRDRGDNSSNID